MPFKRKRPANPLQEFLPGRGWLLWSGPCPGDDTPRNNAKRGLAELWKRVVPGVELHLRSDLPKPRPGEGEELLVKLETALRMHLR